MNNENVENHDENNFLKNTDLFKCIANYINNYETQNKNYKREFNDFNGEVQIKAKSFEGFNINLSNEEINKIKNIIKFNLDDTISLINYNNKVYDLTNLDETNTYINHYLSNINNIILSFNQLLLKLVSIYSLNKCVSFYDKNDNLIIKENNELYQKIRNYFHIKNEIIFDNDKIDDFNCSLKFLKIDKNNLLNNLIENKKIFNENKKVFNFNYYVKNQYRYVKKLEKEFYKEKLAIDKIRSDISRIKNKKFFKNLQNEEEIKKIKQDNVFKLEETLAKFKKIKTELEKLLLKKEKKILLLNEKNNNMISLLKVIKDNLHVVNYLDNKNELFFNNYNAMIEYNKLIGKLKKIKFKKLNIGFEKLFLAGGKSSNNNSIEKLISFFVDNDVIPKFFINIFYLYESLLRHQYSHGWHSALRCLFNSDIASSSNHLELNLNSDDLHKILIDKKTQENYLSQLRNDMKKYSLNSKSDFISRLNLCIEFNMKESFSSIIKEDITSHKELTYNIEMSSDINFLNELILFQKKNNVFIFDEEKINDYIKNCSDKFFCISLNSLIYYIFVFISFYIKINSDMYIENPFNEDKKIQQRINKRKNPDKFFYELIK